jgi:hypothetical protein
MSISVVRQGGHGTLYVPAAVAQAVPPDARFEAELTDEGILFRLLDPSPRLPAWAQDGRKPVKP